MYRDIRYLIDTPEDDMNPYRTRRLPVPVARRDLIKAGLGAATLAAGVSGALAQAPQTQTPPAVPPLSWICTVTVATVEEAMVLTGG